MTTELKPMLRSERGGMINCIRPEDFDTKFQCAPQQLSDPASVLSPTKPFTSWENVPQDSLSPSTDAPGAYHARARSGTAILGWLCMPVRRRGFPATFVLRGVEGFLPWTATKCILK